MPQIVSGLDPQVRINAYLQGQKFQTELQQQQAAQQMEQQKLRQQYMSDLMKHQASRAKSLDDVNARAQMGDVIAMQQQHLEAQAEGLPTDQKMLLETAKMGEGIQDPDARKLFQQHATGLIKEYQESERRKAVEGMIQTGVKDGLMTPEELQQRLLQGEEPEQLGMEITKKRTQRREEAFAAEKNSKAVERVRALLPSLPEDSPEAEQIQKALIELELSPSAQGNPNAGEALLRLARRIAAPREPDRGRELFSMENIKDAAGSLISKPGAKQAKASVEKTKKGLKLSKFGGKTEQAEAPKDIQSAASQLAQETSDPVVFAKRLKSMGFALTAENQAIIKAALSGSQAQAAE